MLGEMIGLLSKMPAEVVSGVLALVRLLAAGKDAGEQRAALDAAMAAAENAVLERSFPRV